MAGYLASNFHTEMANQMAIVKSRLQYFSSKSTIFWMAKPVRYKVL